MLALLVVLAFAGLGYRLIDLQVLRHGELHDEAQLNTQREYLLQPRRGDILDAKGNLLATSIFVKTVCADPSLLLNRAGDVARLLAPLLEENPESLAQKLAPRIRYNQKHEAVTNRYVVLKRKVSAELWQTIQEAMSTNLFGLDPAAMTKAERTRFDHLRKKAVFAEAMDDQLRVYPAQSLAAHVLGYVGMQERELDGKRFLETSGKDGIELTLNSKLSGIRGWRRTETDSRRREMITWREQDVAARDGLNVVLTLDSVIQHYAEEALAQAMEKHSPLNASAIVMRPQTGEILALATLPSFDPNDPGNRPEVRKNRVIADIAEPGSTFKVVVVSAALNEQAVKLTDVFDCEHGRFTYGGRVLHDHESYGVLSVEGIITKSSNIGAAKIGIRLGEQRLYDYMLNFGFGSATGIPLPGEISARLFVQPPKKWSKVSLAQIPMGHGIAVTRLQMIMAMGAIANKGLLMRPMLISRLEDERHNVVVGYSPQRVRQVISESTARQMVQALKTVTTTNGTAVIAGLEHYTVAGKTGTAQKAENGTYVRGKYLSSFIGFFPADNPELCISVVLDEPKNGYYGGTTAAPIFRQIAELCANYLNIRPEEGREPKLASLGETTSGRNPKAAPGGKTPASPVAHN